MWAKSSVCPGRVVNRVSLRRELASNLTPNARTTHFPPRGHPAARAGRAHRRGRHPRDTRRADLSLLAGERVPGCRASLHLHCRAPVTGSVNGRGGMPTDSSSLLRYLRIEFAGVRPVGEAGRSLQHPHVSVIDEPRQGRMGNIGDPEACPAEPPPLRSIPSCRRR